ncbi:MAG: PucR family transcriptional regulator ligand-binding domain-containing protein [Pedococcus sp.]
MDNLSPQGPCRLQSGVLPTLRSVLRSPTVQAAQPELLAGGSNLDRRVRWVHVSEVVDIEDLLLGGELVLSTGLSLGGPRSDPVRYLEDLAAVGACGLMVELSDGFREVPGAAVDTARKHGFPLIVLHQKVRFVDITEEVHRTIVTEQYASLQFGQQVHEAFTALSLEGATSQRIIETTALLCQATVVLEDLSRHVVAHATHAESDTRGITNWQSRSRLTPVTDVTGTCGPEKWVTTPVGVRGRSWGRLVVPKPGARQARESHERLAMVLERAAQALELGRMMDRDRVSLDQQAQGGLLVHFAEGRVNDESDALARAEALGLERSRQYIPAVAHVHALDGADPLAAPRRSRQLLDRVSDAVRSARVSALVGALGPQGVGLLIASASTAQEDHSLERVAGALAAQKQRQPAFDPVALGVGRSSTSILGAASSIRLAEHVAAVASAMPGGTLPFYRNTDIRLRGLIALLQDDPRVQAFAETELDRLLYHEVQHGDGLMELLQQYIDCGGNKSELARVSHRSRPALYKKLDQLERILGVKLDSPASMMSLGVALMAHRRGDPVRR